jgi:hypothetical protein
MPITDHSSDHGSDLFDERLVVLEGRQRVKTMFASSQYAFSVSFMNTESSSVSMPSSENGSCRRTSINTMLRSACSRTSNRAHSVQPVAISVRHQHLNKTPAASRARCGQPDRLRQSPAPDPSSRRTFVSECSVAMCSPPGDGASARPAVGSYVAPGRSSTRSLPAASRGFQTPDPCGRVVPSTRSEVAAAPSVSCRKSAPTPPKELPAHFRSVSS